MNMMMDNSRKVNNIDEYIAGFSPEIQALLIQMRVIIKELVPQAKETISYQIPTFNLEGNLVHFAAYKSHIGFYPGASSIVAFKNDLAAYEYAKGTVKFPFGKDLPIELIAKIVKFREKENLERAAMKKTKRKTC